MMTILSLPFRIVFWLLRAIFTPWYLRWMFRLPWFVYIACAAGLGYLAYNEYERYLVTLDMAFEHAQSRPPASVPLSQFNDIADTGIGDEVVVRGLYFNALPEGDFHPSGLKRSFILLADDQGREVAAALVVSPSDMASMRQMLTSQGTGNRFAVTVNGTLNYDLDWTRLIRAEVDTLGLPTASNIVIIEPFVGNRRAAIMDRTNDDYGLVILLGGLAGFLGLVGFGKVALGGGGSGAAMPATAPAPQPVPQPAPQPTQASPWGTFSPQPRGQSGQRPAADKPLPASKGHPKRDTRKPGPDRTPPGEPPFKSVFPGGGSGFRFKSADEIIRETFGTVSRLTPRPSTPSSDTSDKDA